MSEKLPEIIQTSESEQVAEISKQQQRKLARVVFRIMNLEGHSGVIEVSDDESVIYQVDNPQYPEQGDFAFGGQNAFDQAVTRAFPHGLDRVHGVLVNEEDIVEPYPDEAPGLVYIKQGATVTAKKVPSEVIDQHIDKPNEEKDNPKTSSDVAGSLFPEVK